MSKGLEAFYKLISINDEKVLYAYCGDNFSFPFDKELARMYDGRIEIDLSAFKEYNDGNIDLSEKIKILKDCYYAEKNSYGVDILAMGVISKIFRTYKETTEMPKEGHWVV